MQVNYHDFINTKIHNIFPDTACQKKNLLFYNTTPIHVIHSKLLEDAGVRLLVKREDLNHPTVSGNKWWKLKYNLEEALQEKKQILTFGGAYSNHLYATAGACGELGIGCIGVVRGDEVRALSPTLSFAQEHGMNLHFVSREDFRKKRQPEFIAKLYDLFGDCYLIPEGGTNDLAIHGCVELAETLDNIEFDKLILPVGTGGTIAGLICGIKNDVEIIGVSVLKGDFLTAEINELLENEKKSPEPYGNWRLLTSYHHGGYGKVSEDLLAFIKEMREVHNLPLDPVYTGKLMWAIMEEVRRGSFSRGTTLLALHTGGLQGNSGFAI